MKNKRMQIAIAAAVVTVIVISILVMSCSCGDTTNNKTNNNTNGQVSETSREDITTYLDETSKDELNSSNVANLDETSSDDSTFSTETLSVTSEAETTTESITTTKAPETTTIKKTTTKETTTKAPETTTKVQETTTQKPNLPKVDTSLAILKEYADSYNVAPNVDDWRIYYTEDDCVGDGLDAYRVGLLKYSSDGTQLYVLTTDSEGKMGYLQTNHAMTYPNWEEDTAKQEVFFDAFQDKYQPSTRGWGYDTNVSSDMWGAWSLNPESGNSDPYQYRITYFANVNVYIDSKGALVSVYNWNDCSIINEYLNEKKSCEMVLSANETTKKEWGYEGVETLEDVLLIRQYSLEYYYECEKIAKKYDIVDYAHFD